MDFVNSDVASMRPPKHSFLFLAGAVAGFTVLLLFWMSWNASIEKITTEGFLSASSFVISAIVLLVFTLTLLGLNALLVKEIKIKYLVYALSSIPVLIAPSLVPLVWRLMIAFVLYAASLLCDVAIQKRAALLVRPVLSLIVPSFFRLWLFGLSILLALSIVAHPAVSLREVDISIPEETWQQLWGLFGVELDAGEGGLTIENTSTETQIPIANETIVNEEEIAVLEEILAQNGVTFPDLGDFLESFVDPDNKTVDLSQASDSINDAVSEAAKSETENLFNSVLEPLEPFLPYLVALSFFLSVQIFLPIFVYLGLFCLKISLYVLSALNIVQLTEESAPVSRYVLE